MNSNNRIIFNTVVLYAQIIINMFISLWTVPLVLQALGQSDYGLYNLVAGIVAMLTFLNSSMTVVTQRYMSVTMGTNNMTKLNNVYNASIKIHIILGIILVVILELFTPLLFHGFLNIEPERVVASIFLYQFMIASTFFSILAVPFDATLNAYENMLVFSLIIILEALCRLALALSLIHLATDRLIIYGMGLAIISILGVLGRILIVNIKYADLRIRIKERIPKDLYNDMISYAGWNTFGSVAMIGKNQGLAIVLNLFRGTVINASFGIANQINGMLSSFSSSIQKAIAPQLMKREGASNREAMIEMSFSLIKMATLVFAVFAIPLILEMNQVLTMWLKGDIPPYTILFCQLVLLLQLVFQLSSGVALAIDAVGNVKVYRIVLSCVMILNIPLAYLILKMGGEPYFVLVSMVIVEFCCLIVRLVFAQKTSSFPVNYYFRKCFIPICVVVSVSFVFGFAVKFFLDQNIIRVVTVVFVTFLTTSIVGYLCVLNDKEKKVVQNFVKSLSYTINYFK